MTAFFGGNKDKVTIFGESAGAGSVANHLVMKKSWGKFSSAILESGAFAEWITQPMAMAQTSYDAFLKEMSCSDLSCIQSKTTQELYDASLNIPAGSAYAYAYVPTADAVEIDTHPWVALSNGDVVDVPIIHGTNSDEGASFTPLEKNASDEDLYSFWADTGFSESEINQMKAIYLNQTYPEVDGTSLYWWAGQRSYGDYGFSCASNYASDKFVSLSSHKSPLYLYHFEHARYNANYVSHFTEVPFIFHWQYIGFNDESDKEMSDVMTSYWGNFMIDSLNNPSSNLVGVSDLPQWLPYSKTSNNTLLLPSKEGTKLTSFGIKKEECNLFIPILDENIRTAFA